MRANQGNSLWRLLVLGCVLTMMACATGGDRPVPQRPDSTRTKVLDEYALRVTETARVNAAVRADHDRAVAALETHRYEQAAQLLERVVAAAPALAFARVNLGIAYRELGEEEQALTHLQEAVALSPRHPAAHNELGLVQLSLGDVTAARASFERALGILPGYHYALRNLAIVCELYLQDERCALESYERYLAFTVSDQPATRWLQDLRARADHEMTGDDDE